MNVVIASIVFVSYGLNAFVGINMWNYSIDRRTSKPLTYIQAIMSVLTTCLYVIIESNKLKYNLCGNGGEANREKNRIRRKDWLLWELQYTSFALALFLITMIQYSMELYVYNFHSVGYSSMVGFYVTVQLVVTFVLFVFSFLRYQERILDYVREEQLLNAKKEGGLSEPLMPQSLSHPV